MNAKCPYCGTRIRIKSAYNSCRRHGDVVGMTAESTDYYRCPGCDRVFKYTTNEVKGWQKVTATISLQSKERPRRVHNKVKK